MSANRQPSFTILTALALVAACGLIASRAAAAPIAVASFSTSQTAFTAMQGDLIDASSATFTSLTDNGTFIPSLAGTSLANLNDGIVGAANDGNETTFEEGPFQVDFTLNTTLNPAGYTVNGVRTIAAWPSELRVHQSYELLYNTVSNPTFVSLGTFTTGAPAVGTQATFLFVHDPADGILATSVATLRFNVGAPAGLGTVYREFDVPEPATVSLVAIGAVGALARRRRH